MRKVANWFGDAKSKAVDFPEWYIGYFFHYFCYDGIYFTRFFSRYLLILCTDLLAT
jgi:hypothetical protein